ncbi:MAG: sigma-54-dependent Fis family transcriptional regulator [Bacteroidetes bacterium]|nr:sigma-54-dependent Fis family transcriptional regulator [Bacteroidota bacterium]
MKKDKLNILVIDDDPVYRNLLRSILKEKSNVFAVEAPSLGFKIINNQSIDIIICDFQLPEMSGLKVLEIVKDEYPGIEVIMISASGDMDAVIGALRKGAVDFFKKPFTASEIWFSIERTRKYSELNEKLTLIKNENLILKTEVNNELGQAIIGKSIDVISLKQQMEMVAETPDTSVLIIGESGTGKELVARGIHRLSNRKDQLFGAVNMSAIPESLFESEFFGHKKGSFTGAIIDRAGWFEETNNGTLFLDEIGEMPITLQIKLLRVLEDRKFTKVGSQREHEFDVRIISATNKTLDVLTDGKNFRLDLFHRLGTFVINLPPLRERKGDIIELANYFLLNLAQKMGKKKITSINSEVFDLFNNYSFPGNIRELKNLIERAVIVCQGKELTAMHFTSINLQKAQSLQNANSFDLKELEKQTILKVLQKVNFNKAEAARLLNLEWNALYRRIQKFNIELPSDFS